MDNLDRIQEIYQCVSRLWNECPVYHGSVRDDLHTILDNIQFIKAELLDPGKRHGYWVNRSFCSCCNRFPTKQGTGYDDRELTMYFEYCPHCGAKMDGGAEDDQKT